MKLIKKSTLLSALLLTSMSSLASLNVEDVKNMSDADKKQVAAVFAPEIMEYLVSNPEFSSKMMQNFVDNPEFLIEASKNLQAKEIKSAMEKSKKASIENVKKLVDDPATPYFGKKDSNRVIVIFADYNCVFCKKISPELDEIIKKNPDIKFVFKEYPIFQDRIEGSKFGALVGQKVFSEKGSDAYLKYHNMLMSHKSENDLSAVVKAANSVGLNITDKLEGIGEKEVIAVNDVIELASGDLSISGTPAIVFINTDDLDKNNTVVGYITEQEIQEKINNLK